MCEEKWCKTVKNTKNTLFIRVDFINPSVLIVGLYFCVSKQDIHSKKGISLGGIFY